MQFGHIEGLRGMATICIMLCHIIVYGTFFLPKEQYYAMLSLKSIQAIATSAIFIEIFFVISGFLIGYRLIKEFKDRRNVRLGGFLLRRFVRLYPLYVVILIIAMPFSPANSHYIWTNLLFINNFIPMEDQYVNWSWTVAVEIQFYCIFSFIIWLASKNIIGKKIGTALAIGFIILPSIFVAKYLIQHHYYYITNEVFLISSQEFHNLISIGFDKFYLHTAPLSYGVICAYLYVYHHNAIQHFISRFSNLAINLISLSVITLMLIFLSNNDIWYINRSHDVWQTNTLWLLIIYHHLFLPTLCVLLVLTTAPKGIVLNSIVKVMSSVIWRPIARLSYGTYLLHPLLLLIGYTILTSTDQSISIAQYFKIGLILISLTYFIAIPLYLYFELPMMAWILRRKEEGVKSGQLTNTA
jgi:peptidoglycan/LPS O-acetylase OafA/YrhL